MKAAAFFIILCVQALGTELVVYSSRKEHLIKDVFKQYTRFSGVNIRYKTGQAAALVQTLKAEGAKSPADVLITVDAGNLWFAAEQNLLAKLDSKLLRDNIPAHLRDRQERWFGLSIRARTLVYNTDRLAASALSTYEDLASPRWKKKLCLRTSKKVYNQSLVAMLIFHHGQAKTRRIVEGWVDNAAAVFASDTAVLKAVASGQCLVGIVNSYYFGRLVRQNPELPLKLFWPNQQSYGVHINISGAGVLKTSQKKAEAVKFLEWLSNQAQRAFAQTNMEYSVNPGFKQNPQVESWGAFKANESFHLSLAGKLQRKAIVIMRKANYL